MTIQAAFMLVLFPQVIAALTPAEVLRNYTQWYFQGMVRQKVFTAALDPQVPLLYIAYCCAFASSD
eukprot:m.210464 g.210464  ORF g.210464 m.210464 type:complete len:66 (-) comp15823_c0_seq24:1238-1435(-)